MVVMNPSGDVASRQANLILASTGLMLLIIVPVIAATLWFAWRYRHTNEEATYDPEWHHSTGLEVLIWTAPLMIVVALGAMTWLYTHLLDPYRPLDRIDAARPVTADTRTLTVEVVALDWKWMFFYPELNIATINELVAPVDTPINFRLTSTTVMNAFYVPALSGMIYAMPGMETKLHAVMNQEGVYDGFASNYSGPGFSNMHFKFHGLSDQGFNEWVERVRAEGAPLDTARFMELEKPSELEPVHYYSGVEEGLYRRILNMCAQPGKMCMDEMMHVDAQGGGGHHATGRDALVYDTNRSHGDAGHGPSGYVGAADGNAPEGTGAAESPGATFPAANRPTRSGSGQDEAASGEAPHVEHGAGQQPAGGEAPGATAPAPAAPDHGAAGHEGHGGAAQPAAPGEGTVAPNQLND